jgi:hypothetical protein
MDEKQDFGVSLKRPLVAHRSEFENIGAELIGCIVTDLILQAQPLSTTLSTLVFVDIIGEHSLSGTTTSMSCRVYDDPTFSSASERERNLLVDNFYTKTLNPDHSASLGMENYRLTTFLV